MDISIWERFAQWGMAGIIFGGFLAVLRWVFGINRSVLEAMQEERKANQEILKQYAENVKYHVEKDN